MVEKHMKVAIKTINGEIENEDYKYHHSNHENMIAKKAKDFFVKGFQLDWVYMPHCQRMKDKFIKYKAFNSNLNLNDHSPIIIVNEEKILDDVDEIIEELKDDSYFKSLGIDRVFLKLLRVYPEYCRKKSKTEFINWITNGNSKEYIEKLFSLNGSIEETDSKIDEIIEKIVKEN